MKRTFKGLLTLHLLLNNNCIEELQSITIVASRLAHERVHCLLDFFNFNINQKSLSLRPDIDRWESVEMTSELE